MPSEALAKEGGRWLRLPYWKSFCARWTLCGNDDWPQTAPPRAQRRKIFSHFKIQAVETDDLHRVHWSD